MVLGHSVEFAPLVCSGSNSAARVGCRLLVLTRSSQGGPDCPLRHNFEGRSLRVASALILRRFTVVGTSVFVVGAGIGASRGVPAFKPA